MSTTDTLQDAPPALLFTDAAARKVGELIAAKATRSSCCACSCRAAAARACSTASSSTSSCRTGDTCVENQGVKLLVDPMSLQYLSGAEIDYREGLEGAQFVIRNPNARPPADAGPRSAA